MSEGEESARQVEAIIVQLADLDARIRAITDALVQISSWLQHLHGVLSPIVAEYNARARQEKDGN